MTVIGLARPRRVVKLQGDAASTTAVLCTRCRRQRWVHFDTHGFFAGPDIQSVLQIRSRSDESSRRGGPPRLVASRNPLVLSGLVWAEGADEPRPLDPTTPEGQAILTAEAIAGLPLQGLDLAELSACETGLGTVAGGEGVFGLQRAFHLAGASDRRCQPMGGADRGNARR